MASGIAAVAIVDFISFHFDPCPLIFLFSGQGFSFGTVSVRGMVEEHGGAV